MLAIMAQSDPIAKADPGHMVIKYYKEQELALEQGQHERLRFRCEAQVYQGFVTDPKCQEWLQFNSAMSWGLPKSWMLLLPLLPLLAI